MIKRAKDTKDAIIQFKSSDFDRFAAATGRDYHLVFFLNAAYLAGNSQMDLPGLRKQFALMAKVSVPLQHTSPAVVMALYVPFWTSPIKLTSTAIFSVCSQQLRPAAPWHAGFQSLHSASLLDKPFMALGIV